MSESSITKRFDYLRDPAAIYRQSFATIRAEMDIATLRPEQTDIAVRVAHACGMTDVAGDLRFAGDVAGATRSALAAGGPVFTDTEMAAAAVITRNLPADARLVCTLNDPRARERAAELQTTRSAAATTLWGEDLAGAVVVIGNAPTALFALLEAIDAGGPRPAALFAFPVGFAGAVESKAELVECDRGLTFVTLLGRRGGSAIAGAAFNAVFAGARDR